MNTRHVIGSALLACTIGVTPVAHCDDLASVWQYELTMGGKRPVSTFYFSYQSQQFNTSLFDTHTGSKLRMPLYSTDPQVRTSFTQISKLMRATEEKNTATSIVQGLVGITLLVALPIAALDKATSGDLEFTCLGCFKKPNK